MSRIGETANRPQSDVFHGQVDASRAHQEVLRGLDGKQACPFCGSVSEKSASPCARCGMDNTPEARKATKARIGPWYVLQARNPAAPGMRFETLLSFVRKGRVRARSVVRGPTTHQLWRFAAHVKGLSREFGMCFSCGSAIEPTANICPQCNRLQEPPLNPDVLLEDGSSEAETGPRPVYRELPQMPIVAAPAVAPAVPKKPEEADIVIPAFGAFDQIDSESKPIEIPAAEPTPSPASPPPAFGSAAGRPFTPRPASENPFAISSPGRKKSNGDSFLSAKDLAAAFKLSFDPSADMETVDVPDQMPASAMPEGMRPSAIVPRPQMAPASAVPAFEPVPKQRGGFRKAVLFVLIVVVTGFGVLMWADPDSRAKTFEWAKSSYRKLSQYANGTDTRPARTDADRKPTEKEFKAPVPAPQPTPAKPAEMPTPVAENPPAPTVETPTTPKASPASPAPEKVEPAPAPAPVAKAPTPAAETSAVETASQGEKVTTDNVMTIYRRGVRARGAGDYETAIRDFQAIQKLPREEWPPGVGNELNLAKKALAAQPKK